MIDRATVERIKEAADIVEVVGDYVHLSRRGSNYMGLCPFHNERTPSFSVNKARNFCYCFSCHKGGSPVNFIMEKEGVSYHEALLHLARKYGIEVREKELTDEEKEKMTLREGMFIANEWASSFFEKTINETTEGKDIGLSYLFQRKIVPEAIKAFHLGYCPEPGSVFSNEAIKKGLNPDVLENLGLIGKSNFGGYYDKYRGRVIFPIHNSSGKVIAFGGRDLKGGTAKYINSPESEIYKKSNELYGIFQAKSAIVKEDRCFLVEGYLDVISMWQAGVKNVVASSGTALTDGQINLIHRFTNNVTLVYDGDNAGIKAALRGMDMLLSHNLDLKVILLPGGHDPDSLSKELGPEKFREFIDANQQDIIRFKAEILAGEAADDPQKRVSAIRSIVTSLAHIPDKVKRDVYVQECASILSVSENSIIGDIARQREQIINEEKVKRRRSELQNFTSKQDDRESVKTISPVQSGTTPETQETKAVLNSLAPVEWNVLQYCLKYGFMKLWDYEDENGETVDVSLLEYVAEELKLDNLEFSNEEYRLIFNQLLETVPEFKNELTSLRQNLKIESEERKELGKAKIRESSLSLEQISREEEKLENEIISWWDAEIKDFSRNFSVKKFASHENHITRRHATKAFSQKHVLSNIYRRDGNIVEEEEDKLLTLIVNAVNVLKNGILDLEVKKLMQQLRTIPSDDVKRQDAINSRISNLLLARSRMAKDIGDRIISPFK